MNRNRQEKGITLIALVITIIVLLILAGISIASLTGSGLLERAKESKQKSEQAQAEEEIKLVLYEWQMVKISENITFVDFLDAKKNETKEIDDYTELEEDGNIEIYRKKYYLVVDSEGNIIEEIQLAGPSVKISDLSIKLEDGTEAEDNSVLRGTKLIIDFKAYIDEKEINDINPKLPYKTDGTEDKITFKITMDTDEGKYTKNFVVSLKDKYIKTFESIEEAAKIITREGEQTIQITAEEDDVIHEINTIIYNEDLVLDGTTQVKGATLQNKVYEFGDKLQDVATQNKDAKNTVLLKVNGNITINENVTLTTCKSDDGYGGPKGLVIYCTGKIINNGEITMTKRGAKAEGQNVYLYKNQNGTYEKVLAKGGDGASGITYQAESGKYNSKAGNPGSPGLNRATGGGGSGSMYSHRTSGVSRGKSGAGSQGSSYSGGSGGGACSAVWTSTDVWYSSSSDANSKGGDAVGSYNLTYPAGGGAGNPGGTGYGVSEQSNGTGGLLIIYCNEIENNSTISSNGSAGSQATNLYASVNGGCSGGGSINIFAKEKIKNYGKIEAKGGTNTNGGAGGDGTVNLGYITGGNYVSF